MNLHVEMPMCTPYRLLNRQLLGRKGSRPRIERSVEHPPTRGTDDIFKVAGSWMHVAEDCSAWHSPGEAQPIGAYGLKNSS